MRSRLHIYIIIISLLELGCSDGIKQTSNSDKSKSGVKDITALYEAVSNSSFVFNKEETNTSLDLIKASILNVESEIIFKIFEYREKKAQYICKTNFAFFFFLDGTDIILDEILPYLIYKYILEKRKLLELWVGKFMFSDLTGDLMTSANEHIFNKNMSNSFSFGIRYIFTKAYFGDVNSGVFDLFIRRFLVEGELYLRPLLSKTIILDCTDPDFSQSALVSKLKFIFPDYILKNPHYQHYILDLYYENDFNRDIIKSYLKVNEKELQNKDINFSTFAAVWSMDQSLRQEKPMTFQLINTLLFLFEIRAHDPEVYWFDTSYREVGSYLHFIDFFYKHYESLFSYNSHEDNNKGNNELIEYFAPLADIHNNIKLTTTELNRADHRVLMKSLEEIFDLFLSYLEPIHLKRLEGLLIEEKNDQIMEYVLLHRVSIEKYCKTLRRIEDFRNLLSKKEVEFFIDTKQAEELRDVISYLVKNLSVAEDKYLKERLFEQSFEVLVKDFDFEEFNFKTLDYKAKIIVFLKIANEKKPIKKFKPIYEFFLTKLLSKNPELIISRFYGFSFEKKDSDKCFDIMQFSKKNNNAWQTFFDEIYINLNIDKISFETLSPFIKESISDSIYAVIYNVLNFNKVKPESEKVDLTEFEKIIYDANEKTIEVKTQASILQSLGKSDVLLFLQKKHLELLQNVKEHTGVSLLERQNKLMATLKGIENPVLSTYKIVDINFEEVFDSSEKKKKELKQKKEALNKVKLDEIRLNKINKLFKIFLSKNKDYKCEFFSSLRRFDKILILRDKQHLLSSIIRVNNSLNEENEEYDFKLYIASFFKRIDEVIDKYYTIVETPIHNQFGAIIGLKTEYMSNNNDEILINKIDNYEVFYSKRAGFFFSKMPYPMIDLDIKTFFELLNKENSSMLFTINEIKEAIIDRIKTFFSKKEINAFYLDTDRGVHIVFEKIEFLELLKLNFIFHGDENYLLSSFIEKSYKKRLSQKIFDSREGGGYMNVVKSFYDLKKEYVSLFSRECKLGVNSLDLINNKKSKKLKKQNPSSELEQYLELQHKIIKTFVESLNERSYENFWKHMKPIKASDNLPMNIEMRLKEFCGV